MSLSVVELAAMAGVHPQTVYRAVRRGDLPVKRIGNVIVINDREGRVWAAKPHPEGRPRKPSTQTRKAQLRSAK